MVVFSHFPEAPEAIMQPGNVEHSLRPPSIWVWDLKSVGIRRGGQQAIFNLEHFPLWLEMLCAIAIVYLWFLTVSRYAAMPKELLILLYVLDTCSWYMFTFCIFVVHSISSWPHSTFFVLCLKIGWHFRNIHIVFNDQLSHSCDPCHHRNVTC